MSSIETASPVIDSLRTLREREASPGPRRRPAALYFSGVIIVACVLLAIVLHWGGFWLISNDSVNVPVEAAVVPQGSVLGEQARLAESVRVLQDAKAERILISVPRESYWGQPIAPIARVYIEKQFGIEAASRVDFCEMASTDSTEEEAELLLACIAAHHWNSLAIVTSDYHTARTKVIWRRLLKKRKSSLAVVVHAAPDPEFRPDKWWGERRSAKTWLLEATKLLWTLTGW